MYARKTLHSLAAGYRGLEATRGGGEDRTWTGAVPGWDEPYYVCARFGDGRHIPGPILADRAHQRGLQGLVVRIALALRVPAAVQARDAFVAYAAAHATAREIWEALPPGQNGGDTPDGHRGWFERRAKVVRA